MSGRHSWPTRRRGKTKNRDSGKQSTSCEPLPRRSWPIVAFVSTPARTGSSGKKPAWSRFATRRSHCIASRWKCGSLPNKCGRKSMAPSARHRRRRLLPNYASSWLTNIASKKNSSHRGAELVELGDRIAEQHRDLTQMKNGVREWAVARQSEIEQQAAGLVERELTLDGQQQELLKARHRWDCERRSTNSKSAS